MYDTISGANCKSLTSSSIATDVWGNDDNVAVKSQFRKSFRRVDSHMQGKDEINGLRRVKSHHKRRCPYCDSNKWEWLGAAPTSSEELTNYLLVKYRCKKCGNIFLAEEAKKSRYVKSADRCIYCNSPNVEQTSKPNADIKLFRCRKCNAYMAIGEPVEDGPIIVDENGTKIKNARL